MAACATRSSGSSICCKQREVRLGGLVVNKSVRPNPPECRLLVVARVAAGAAHVPLGHVGRRFARLARRIRFGLARQTRR